MVRGKRMIKLYQELVVSVVWNASRFGSESQSKKAGQRTRAPAHYTGSDSVSGNRLRGKQITGS